MPMLGAGQGMAFTGMACVAAVGFLQGSQ